MSPQDDRERLRQIAETAGSLAPRDMRRAIERERPPDPRLRTAASRPGRVATALMMVLLVGSIAAVGVLMAAAGYGLFVALFIVVLLAVWVYAWRRARHGSSDHS